MIERRALGAELRAAPGRRIVGRVMRYGDVATVRLPDGSVVEERFASFAFHDYLRSGAATRLNLMHDQSIVVASTGTEGRGKLALRDHPDGLEMVATLPSGDAYDAALALVADGSTAETSVEFRALEDRIEGDRRTVLQATLPGIGLVDRGAYGGAVEHRASGKKRVTGAVPLKKPLGCECTGPRCDTVSFDAAAFDDLPDEVLAVAGEYKRPLGSLKRGNFRLDRDGDALRWSLDIDPATSTVARELVEAADVVPIYGRPLIHPERSEFEDVGQVRHYRRAWLRALILGPTDTDRGQTPVEIEDAEDADEGRRHQRDRERMRAERASRGRRIWL